jgi:hypothetical protein
VQAATHTVPRAQQRQAKLVAGDGGADWVAVPRGLHPLRPNHVCGGADGAMGCSHLDWIGWPGGVA